ncbi:MAG: protein translocase subunit SecF [Acidimicrobiales bacterium]|nr:protein translocase subunit SecF [Acidimicrobiales bacterium]
MNAVRRLFRGENDYDFVRSWRYGLALSATLLALSLILLLTRGLALGLDFEGGTAWDVPTSTVSVEDARDVLRPLGEDSAKIQTIGSDILRVQSAVTDAAKVSEVRAALAGEAGVAADQVAVTTVGPTWGDEISNKAIRALVLFVIAIAAYITFALRDWRMAVGAIASVVHDIVISVGFYALLQVEVTPATVIAFLTILGFSLYDTVVVYARIRDNSPMVSIAGRMTYTEMASRSLNEVLMRSINTSITAVLPVLSILVVGSLIFGATTLQEFGVALLVGLIIGVYSSIFIATPIAAYLNERQPTYRKVRERLAARGEIPLRPGRDLAGAGAGDLAAARTGTDKPDGDGGPGAAKSAAEPKGRPSVAGSASPKVPAAYSASHPPRPRKNKRR